MTGEEETMRRPRVLLLAYACAPNRGTEPGVGWNRALLTARRCDTWVVCETNEFADEIRDYLDVHGPVPGLSFHYVSTRAWERVLRRLPALNYLAYYLWHRRALTVCRRLHNTVGFDLVHQVNMCGFREPGFLWKLDAPFVWGPVGGTQNFPWRFLGELGLRGAAGELLRTLVNNLQLRFSPRVRKAMRRASAMMTANTTGQRDFARVHGVEPLCILETGAPPLVPPRPEKPSTDGTLRILWSGLHIHRKGMPLLIKALAQLPAEVRYELRVLGGGPLTRRWRRLAKKTGVDSHTTWLGKLPYAEAMRNYQWADLFAFTSLRDTTGNVILEAMANGVPVICLDHQGAADIVDASCGVTVPVVAPKTTIAAWSREIAALASDPQRLATMSHAALRRADELSWPRQDERIAAVYRTILADTDYASGDPEKKLPPNSGCAVVTHGGLPLSEPLASS